MRSLLLFTLFFVTTQLPAQVWDFGDVPIDQLSMSIYEKDSTAKAVVIFDTGESELTYKNDDFQMLLRRHVRVKILTDEGLGLGDISIAFRTEDPKQKISKIKAQSYNLMPDGSVQKKSIGRRDRHTEKRDDRWSEIKFNISDLKAGSVFEFSYELNSNHPLDLQDWFFQREIPVIWSEYQLRIPEWFNYVTVTGGYHPYKVNSQDFYFGEVEFGAGSWTSSLNYRGVKYHMVMTNLPAIADEPYITLSTDYLAHVRFRLAYYQLPGDDRYNFLTSWQDQLTNLMDYKDFGGRLKDTRWVNDAISEIEVDSLTQQQVMINAYNYISSKIDWNENFGIYSFDSIHKAFEVGSANGATINMALIQLLRGLGLEAHPVLLSTSMNGQVIKSFPNLDQFNHVISYVEIGETKYLIDAKNKLRPYNVLPSSVLNREGLLVVANSINWMPIEATSQNKVTRLMEINFSDTSMTGKLISRERGLYSVEARELFDGGNITERIKEYLFDNPEISVDSAYIDKDVPESSFDYSAYFQIENVTQSDIIYFNPMLVDLIERNPFVRNERHYPIDYGFTFERSMIINMQVPEGWAIDELPESVLHRLPDNGGEFRRIVQDMGDRISISYRFLINKHRFKSNSYNDLKLMYDQMVLKLAQNIVLKKEV